MTRLLLLALLPAEGGAFYQDIEILGKPKVIILDGGPGARR